MARTSKDKRNKDTKPPKSGNNEQAAMQSTVLAKRQGAHFTLRAVTGPRTDLWLVQTMGALVTYIGDQLLLSSSNESEVHNWETARGRFGRSTCPY